MIDPGHPSAPALAPERHAIVPSSSHFALVLSLAVPACATNDGTFASDDDLVASIITTTVGGGVSTTGAVLGLDLSESSDDLWVANRRETEIALARGTGPWIDDVAARIALPAGLVPRLGAALHRQRDYLLGVLARDLLTTHDWMAAVGAVVCCDPWLRAFAEPRLGCTPPVSEPSAQGDDGTAAREGADTAELRCTP